MSQLPRPNVRDSSRLGRRIALALALGLTFLVCVGVWASALTEPVVRAGVPTGSVTPPPPKATPTPKPTPSATPSAQTAKPKPTPTPTPSKKPSKQPKPDQYTTSTARQGSVSGVGTEHRFIVKVQSATGEDANKVAREVAEVLNDPRSWAGSGEVRFALVKDAAKADFTVYLSAPQVADSGCAKDAWVCVKGSKLVLSAAGWKNPPATYEGDQTGFRRYLVNHAVGRYLGEKTASCSKAGRPAPVMAAQGDDLKGCTPNPWP